MPEIQKQPRENAFVYEINAFELGPANSHNSEEGNCHRQSMC